MFGDNRNVKPTKKILFVVVEDWFFCSHYMPMAIAAREDGFEIVVVTRVIHHADVIESAGCRLIHFDTNRRSRSPAAYFVQCRRLSVIFQHERPDIIHLISLKAMLLGGLAARWVGIDRVVFAATGVGYLAIAGDIRAKLIRAALMPVFRWLLSPGTTRLLLENHEDGRFFHRHSWRLKRRTFVVGGCGIDPERVRMLPVPRNEVPVAAVVTRMVWSKGVDVFFEAQQLLWRRGIKIRIWLVGGPDSANPRSIPETQLRAWARCPGVDWLGVVSNFEEVWCGADIAVVPSRGGEGLPRSLLEAAACGRPIITTDVPGCRDFVRDRKEGLIVPPGDINALANALAALASNSELRCLMGANARARIYEGFRTADTMAIVRKLYSDMIASPSLESPGLVRGGVGLI